MPNLLPANLQINVASACLPGLKFASAVQAITAGKLKESAWGFLSGKEIQLCPQTLGHLDEASCEALVARYPQTKFRLHANARVLPTHHRLALADFTPTTKPYFVALADRSHRLHASAYSLHAGNRASGSLTAMVDKWSRLQELFGDIPVAVEGLYPHGNHRYLMDSWNEYEQVFQSRVPVALDLSHLNIVAQLEGWHDDLLAEFLRSPQCLEVHISLNDGSADQHLPFCHSSVSPSWLPLLIQSTSPAVIFSEGNQFRQGSSRRHKR